MKTHLSRLQEARSPRRIALFALPVGLALLSSCSSGGGGGGGGGDEDVVVPDVNFNGGNLVHPENAGTVSVEVTLSKAGSDTVELPYTVSGTASAEDFTLLSPNPLMIEAGQTSALIHLDAIDDALFEGDESIVITLGEPTNGTKGSVGEITITLTSEDALTAQFTTTASNAVEGDIVSITIELNGAAPADVLVGMAASGTAMQGFEFVVSDYEGTPGVLDALIPEGESSATVTITTGLDYDYACPPALPSLTAILTLTSVDNDGVLGAQTVHTLTFQDDLAFAEVEPNNNVPESAAVGLVTDLEIGFCSDVVGWLEEFDSGQFPPSDHFDTFEFEVTSDSTRIYAITKPEQTINTFAVILDEGGTPLTGFTDQNTTPGVEEFVSHDFATAQKFYVLVHCPADGGSGGYELTIAATASAGALFAGGPGDVFVPAAQSAQQHPSLATWLEAAGLAEEREVYRGEQRLIWSDEDGNETVLSRRQLFERP